MVEPVAVFYFMAALNPLSCVKVIASHLVFLFLFLFLMYWSVLQPEEVIEPPFAFVSLPHFARLLIFFLCVCEVVGQPSNVVI